jgi:16S rRNA A1518/A1519 N6-dimethyltransferase RsmA/KsgA/DIM1 with predicted DNA glycosylase/AP lyase activity
MLLQLKVAKRKFVIVKNKLFPSPDMVRRINFYSQFISPDDLCFDVGANMGNRIEALLKLRAKVVVIEPQTKCHEILKRVFGNKIILVIKGLGEKEEEKIFHQSNLSVISSFSEE